MRFKLFQVCPSVLPPFLFAVLFLPSCNVERGYFLCFTKLGVSSHCLNFDKFRETATALKSFAFSHAGL